MREMECFIKTDRLKISGTTNSPEEAESIFKEIEEKTGAKIQWENGNFTTTYKRDPIIRLCGPVDSVKTAREMVLQNLEIQSNRIVLKMDIAHEEHPSLIGKKGCLIKKIMESTNCHIHFPDMNKISAHVKSNQVSIAGEPANVEKARVMLRALLPFQVSFEIEKSKSRLINTSADIWKCVEQQFGITIHFVNRKHVMCVLIRCNQSPFPVLRQQILGLIEFITEKRGSDLPPVKVVMDIMPQNHNFVKGHKGSNIHAIASRTGAKIVFPNLNTVISERRCVCILGNLDCVYMAWQEIMSSLPVFVCFDINESRETTNDYTDFLLDCNISVYSRPKPRYHTKSVTVKGPEKFSKIILQYRQWILNLSAIKFQPDIEYINKALTFQSCHAENQESQIGKNFTAIPLGITTNDYGENLSNILRTSNCVLDTENSVIPTPLSYNATSFAPISSIDFSTFNKLSFARSEGNGSSDWRSHTPTYHTTSSSDAGNSLHSMLKSWGKNCSKNKNETVIKDPENFFERSASVNETSMSLDNQICPDSPPFKKKSVNQFEIFEKRLSAHQAIHRRIESTQVPSGLWAGYGFSQSMPAAACVRKNNDLSNQYSCTSLESNTSSSSEGGWDSIILNDYIDDKILPDKEENVFSMSNVFDFKRNTSAPLNFDSKDILPKLLYEEGLYNYIDVFLREEIDYAAFLLLNEYDLMNLKINYQGRMKLSCLIRELQDREMKAKTFDAAPGAGRIMSA